MSFVGASLMRGAASYGSAPALVTEAQVLTYRALDREIETIAAGIREKTKFQDRIAITAREPDRLLRGFLAAARVGRVGVIFDPKMPDRSNLAVRRQLEIALELDDDALAHMAAARPSQAMRRYPSTPSEASFYIGLTSGTTGTPKGFRRSHQSWLNSFDLGVKAFNLRSDDRFLIPGGLSHSLHLFGALQGLHIGGHVRLAAPFSPKRIIDHIRGDAITVLYATPTQLRLLSQSVLSDKGEARPRLRLILTSGAKLHDTIRSDARKAFPEAEICEFFGTSEMSFVSANSSSAPAPAESVGRPLPGVEVKICAPDGTPMRPGETGRLWVRSDMLFEGYELGDDGQTLWSEGWLTVGDCGYLDEHGFLYLTGRVKRMMIVAGVNVFAEEIERVLNDVAGVEEAAVFGVSELRRGARIFAAVKCVKPLEAEVLRNLCRQQLGAIKTPSRILFVSDWPLLAGGKTDLKTLEKRVIEEITR